jgi:type VI secretion system secreted protein VgrG
VTFTQENRQIAIKTPLGDDKLLLRAFHGKEAISQMFSFELELLSEDDSISFDDMVGQRVDIRIALADGTPRFWNGFVSRFSQSGRDQNLCVYHATVVPWLWFLTRKADCRIFQKKKVPDIIQQIFSELGFHDFSLKLYGDFVEREYCVQYRETNFNFVSRLMEEEGIFFFFKQEEGRHTLVLANDPAAHDLCPNQPKARYELSAGGWQDDDVVLRWRSERELRSGAFSYTDYNFETPTVSLFSTVNGQGKYEIYDYPGEYKRRSEGDQLVRIRLEEEDAPQVVARGESDCRAFTTGYRFELTDHYRKDLNQAYVLTALEHKATQALDFTSGGGSGFGWRESTYRNGFACIPYSTPFRPPRVTPTPVVKGCQSAVVVGPSGEEIFTDNYSRVKVQFHWDREGKRNENSSCWIRVSQPWAGKNWGAINIPRIGQEVLVDFLEGDPDQPIIIGRVYNAAQMPPFDLPGKAVISGIKSNSTKGGGGYNEISLDDTKGNEVIHIHGQHDMTTVVEHDQSTTVVTGKQTDTVKQDITITSQSSQIHVTAATEIKLEVGASSILMKADGTITVKGTHIDIEGAMLTELHGGITDIKGMPVKINS